MNTLVAKPSQSPLELAHQLIRQIAQTPFVLQEVEGNREQNRYLLHIGERRFYVGAFIYRILQSIQTKADLNHITAQIQQDHPSEDVSNNDIATVLNEHVAPLFHHVEAPKSNAVKSLFGVMNPEKIDFLIRPLSVLFHKPVFRVLFVATILVNLFFFAILNMGISKPEAFVYTSFEQNVIFFFVVIGFLVFHELGHAAASHHFGVPPGEIGFGIYFIFPAFYTDLTAVWSLHRKDRVVINLGGIYFQLLINLVLIALLFYYQQNEVLAYFLKRAILLNCLVSLYNLNPFFRFDGYWIFSDYFDIPNLRKQANEFLLQIGRYLGHNFWNNQLTYQLTRFLKPPQYALIAYAFGYAGFMTMVWFYIVRFILSVHKQLFEFIQNLHNFNVHSIAQWTTVLPLLFLTVIAWVTLYFLIRKIFTLKHSWQTSI